MDTLDEPGFTPVPSASTRHDGWTPERQRGFVAALAQIGVVGAAAKAVGMSARTAYALRKRAGAESFAAAWDAAVDCGRARATDAAIQRALHGVAQPVFYRGLQVGERRLYNDRLLIAVLRATTPGGSTVAFDPDELGSPHARGTGP